MRILVLQFIPGTRGRPVPRFEPQLGTLLALLERRGHALALEGLGHFDVNRVKAALARALPQLIYADISAICVAAARRTLEYIEHHEFLPIVVGGIYPTVDPEAALSLPGVRAVAIGEPDASLVTWLERIKDPAGAQVVSGVWLRDEAGLSRPALPPLVEDLNSLPFPHRELFNYAAHVQQTGQIEIAVGRGCPLKCAYCVNPTMAELYANHGTWVRRRSPPNILAEIALLRDRYPGVRQVRFLDHAFALETGWLHEFLTAYKARCGLPFRCPVRVQAADDEAIQLLASGGCAWADIEVISGGDFIRNDVFFMDVSEGQIKAAFAKLKTNGIRTRAIVYLGSPYESEVSLEQTRALLLAVKPDAADIHPYHPWPGTAARKLAQEHGWVHARDEEQYHHGQPGIDMPACRPEVVAAFIRRLRAELPANVDDPWWRRWSAVSRTALGQVFQRRTGSGR